jgi:beta-glucosidase
MWELYLEPFRVAFKEAGAMGTMASYNDYDGIPIISSHYFLTDILRKQFGFKGYVVSDSHAFEDLFSKHHVAADTADAARMALTAGMNVRTDFQNPRDYINGVRRAVKNGSLSTKIVDERVKEVLRVKFWLGLFNHPYQNAAAADTIVHNNYSRGLALEAAREGIVLLKNDNNILPLDKNNLTSVAIIGPNAKEYNSLLSRYGPVLPEVITVYGGLSKAFPPSVKVSYAEGCKHTDANFPESDVEDFPLTAAESALMDAAVSTASGSAVVLLVLGDNENTIGETHSRLSLNLPGRQELLLERIAALNKPTILIHVGGRPTALNFAKRTLPAIIETWYLGEQTGNAIADVLFGIYNPSGKLCAPFPRHVGQIPLSFPMKSYTDARGDANVSGFLFPFGYGLSYTSFQYSGLKVNTEKYKIKGEVIVQFKIKNTGRVAGTEIAQLYLHDEVSSVTTYDKKLRGFERIYLSPGEEKEVTMILETADFSLYNREMKFVMEPGWFEIMAGASSEDIRLRTKLFLN